MQKALMKLTLYACVVLFVTVNSARGGYSFDFKDAVKSQSGPFVVEGIGQYIDINVNLREDPTSLNLQSIGLIGFGVRIPSVTSVVELSSVVISPSFAAISQIDLGSGFVDLLGASFDPVFPNASGSLVLATLRFKSIALGIVNIAALDIPVFSSTALANDEVIDDDIRNAGSSISVIEPLNVVPEPSTLAGVCVGVALAVLARRHQARRLGRDPTV